VPWTIADLRTAITVADTEKYTRMRMTDYFCDQPAFACVTETNGTTYTHPI
jgi:erythromycin esterase